MSCQDRGRTDTPASWYFLVWCSSYLLLLLSFFLPKWPSVSVRNRKNLSLKHAWSEEKIDKKINQCVSFWLIIPMFDAHWGYFEAEIICYLCLHFQYLNNASWSIVDAQLFEVCISDSKYEERIRCTRRMLPGFQIPAIDTTIDSQIGLVWSLWDGPMSLQGDREVCQKTFDQWIW